MSTDLSQVDVALFPSFQHFSNVGPNLVAEFTTKIMWFIEKNKWITYKQGLDSSNESFRNIYK